MVPGARTRRLYLLTSTARIETLRLRSVLTLGESVLLCMGNRARDASQSAMFADFVAVFPSHDLPLAGSFPVASSSGAQSAETQNASSEF